MGSLNGDVVTSQTLARAYITILDIAIAKVGTEKRDMNWWHDEQTRSHDG